MQLKSPLIDVFDQLRQVLKGLSDDEYTAVSERLSGNSVGKHMRHIIELYQCLLEGYLSGCVDYAGRKRDTAMENNRELAWQLLHQLEIDIDRPNKALTVMADYQDANGEAIILQSNYYRELAFNLEHTIHHMALIRIGLEQCSGVVLPATFGVAFATINFRNQCAQ